jgi:hypothetical protein
LGIIDVEEPHADALLARIVLGAKEYGTEARHWLGKAR